MFTKLKLEYNSFARSEKFFILFAMICSFCISIDASIIKPVSSSIFLSNYGVKWLPYAWLMLIPVNFGLVHLYTRFINRLGPVKMLLVSLMLSSSLNVYCATHLDTIHSLPFIYFLWKDIYILLMFQQLWSVIHSTISLKRAKYLYGIFYGMGGLGSVIGSIIPGFFAVEFGSAHLLLFTLPFQVILATVYFLALRVRSNHPELEPLTLSKENSNFFKGVKLIKNSSLLIFILSILTFMQLIATLLDFNFNTFIEKTIPLQDVRTEYLARFFGVINIANICLQFLGSFLLVYVLGIKRAHSAIPTVLAIIFSLSLVNPSFALIALSFASVKAVDYSFFGIIKEMLYIPLSTEEKFHAKAVIDVFVYRSSKAIASVVILVLQLFIVNISYVLSITILAVFLMWIATVHLYFKRNKDVSFAHSK